MKTRLDKKGEKSGIVQDLRSVKTLEDFIDVGESMDVIIKNDCDIHFIIKQAHKDRGFSNILFIGDNIVIHHIYMHYKEYFYCF